LRLIISYLISHMKKLIVLLTLFSFASLASEKLPIPTYLKLFDSYLIELHRLDGDGLLPRTDEGAGRTMTWPQVTKQLRKDLSRAKTKFEVGNVFRRLDAAYTNLHAHIDLSKDYNFESEGHLQLAVAFWPDQLSENGEVNKYIVSNVRKEYFSNLEPEQRPKLMDELISINGRNIKSWQDENMNFCKFPLKSQCELNFKDNFKMERLSWNRRKPLKMTVKRGGKLLSFNIPVISMKGWNPSEEENSGSKRGPKELPPPPENCRLSPDRYPDFKLVYQGLQACAYEKTDLPNVTLLRIGGFSYWKNKYKTDINNVRVEAEKFYQLYWKRKASETKKLIIDVVSNHGGDIITPWGALFIESGFQDQWVEFKNLKEYAADEQWRKDSFYDDPSKYTFFKDYQAKLASGQLKSEDYMPRTPQFCPTDEGDCYTEKWPSKKTGFKGDVIILTDEMCISSCVGFVWTMKTYLKDRVKFVGVPDSGDSTYSRAYVEGGLDNSKQGYYLKAMPRPPKSSSQVNENAIFKYAVSTSRQTDEKGAIISGKPQKIDLFMYPHWREDPNEWTARMLKVVVEKISEKQL
jgi:hypothetical protein